MSRLDPSLVSLSVDSPIVFRSMEIRFRIAHNIRFRKRPSQVSLDRRKILHLKNGGTRDLKMDRFWTFGRSMDRSRRTMWPPLFVRKYGSMRRGETKPLFVQPPPTQWCAGNVKTFDFVVKIIIIIIFTSIHKKSRENRMKNWNKTQNVACTLMFENRRDTFVEYMRLDVWNGDE